MFKCVEMTLCWALYALTKQFAFMHLYLVFFPRTATTILMQILVCTIVYSLFFH